MFAGITLGMPCAKVLTVKDDEHTWQIELVEDKSMLTEAKKKQYVREGGVRCPYCGSKEIAPGKIRTDFVVTVDVDCEACHRRWQERYDLAGVYELGDQGLPVLED